MIIVPYHTIPSKNLIFLHNENDIYCGLFSMKSTTCIIFDFWGYYTYIFFVYGNIILYNKYTRCWNNTQHNSLFIQTPISIYFVYENNIRKWYKAVMHAKSLYIVVYRLYSVEFRRWTRKKKTMYWRPSIVCIYI